MYDELIEALRLCVKHGKAEDALENAKQAADAIEELSAIREEQKAQIIAMAAEDKPRWIPVTELLPNGEAERYLVAASLMSLGLRVSICYYADNLEEVDEYDFKDKNHGGFYGYDDEYGYYERSGVKYWMSLPEPPKER